MADTGQPADEDRPAQAAAPAPTARRPPGARPWLLVGGAGLVALVVAAVATVLLGGGSAAGGGAAAGSGGTGTAGTARVAAPAFTLPALAAGGAAVGLTGVTGRPVVLNFFASWCPPCRREVPLLARTAAASRGVAFIGVDVNDSTGPARSFLAATGARYPVGVDRSGHVAAGYGVLGLPQTFFLDRDHRVVARVPGELSPAALRHWLAVLGAAGS